MVPVYSVPRCVLLQSAAEYICKYFQGFLNALELTPVSNNLYNLLVYFVYFVLYDTRIMLENQLPPCKEVNYFALK